MTGEADEGLEQRKTTTDKKRKTEEGGSVVNDSGRRRRKRGGRKTPRLTQRDPSALLISSLPPRLTGSYMTFPCLSFLLSFYAISHSFSASVSTLRCRLHYNPYYLIVTLCLLLLLQGNTTHKLDSDCKDKYTQTEHG